MTRHARHAVAVFVVLSLTTGCAWWQERSRTTKGEPARGDGGAARRTGSREPRARGTIGGPRRGTAVDETQRPTPRDLAVSRTATTDVNFGGRSGSRTVVACV